MDLHIIVESNLLNTLLWYSTIFIHSFTHIYVKGPLQKHHFNTGLKVMLVESKLESRACVCRKYLESGTNNWACDKLNSSANFEYHLILHSFYQKGGNNIINMV